MPSRDDILADRLNVEPAIFKGCSSSELGIIVGVAALIWLPVSLLLAGLMGAVTMGFGLAGVGVVGTVIVMAGLFQRLKRGRPDGYYQQQVVIWSPYVTPRYRAELVADMEMKGRQGELAYRVRGVQEIPGHGYEERRVDLLAPGVWVVWLDLELSESVKGMTVKRTAIRYPLRVVSLDVDPEANPWGLALDGFAAEGPRRLTESDRRELTQK